MEHNSGTGKVKFSDSDKFSGIKVFSATMVRERNVLGEKVTQWIADNPQFRVTEIIVTQSSDEAFHCITLTVSYIEATE